MRQVLSWRFVAAIVALAVAALGVQVLFNRASDVAEVVERSAPVVKRADLVALVYSADGNRFSVGRNGLTRGELTLTLLGDQGADPPVATIFPGTPGQVSCRNLDQIGQCAVLADLLGDAVVRFALVPMGPSFTFELPAITELDGGFATLVNGWQVPYATVIDRARCDSPAESFSEFQKMRGNRYKSIFTLSRGEITAVTC